MNQDPGAPRAFTEGLLLPAPRFVPVRETDSLAKMYFSVLDPQGTFVLIVIRDKLTPTVGWGHVTENRVF